MKFVLVIFIVLLSLVVLVCFSVCSIYKEERFKNKLVEEFVSNKFDIDNSKYNMLKIGDILVIVYIDNYNDYLINIEFFSKVKQSIFVTEIIAGSRKISINKEVDINHKLKNNLYSGKIMFPGSEDLLSIKKEEIFNQIKEKKIPITINLKIKNQDTNITIILEQYTAKGIVWPT